MTYPNPHHEWHPAAAVCLMIGAEFHKKLASNPAALLLNCL